VNLGRVEASDSSIVFATELPDSIPNNSSITRTISFPLKGKVVSMELFIEFQTQCEKNHRAELIDPGGPVVSVMERGFGRCGGTPLTFTSRSNAIGAPDFFQNRQAKGTRTFTMFDLEADAHRGQLTDVRLTIAVQSPKPVQSEPPSINALNPASGTVGTTVTLKGERFGQLGKLSEVYFGSNSAAIKGWKSTRIVVTAHKQPRGAIDVVVQELSGLKFSPRTFSHLRRVRIAVENIESPGLVRKSLKLNGGQQRRPLVNLSVA